MKHIVFALTFLAFALAQVARVTSEGRGDPFLQTSFGKAKNEVNKAVKKTKDHHQNIKGKKKRPKDLLRALRMPDENMIARFTAREMLERTLIHIMRQAEQNGVVSHTEELDPRDLISSATADELVELSGCPQTSIDCSQSTKYRKQDGTCNNQMHPRWGSAPVPFKRLLDPIYENDFDTPVGWNSSKLYGGYAKPSARLVSTELVGTVRVTDDQTYTHMLMQWGQFLDHDMDLTPAAVSAHAFENEQECTNNCAKLSPCFPIEIPTTDTRITTVPCLGFTRSAGICNPHTTGTLQPRQQANEITSYIDASNIYGSSNRELENLLDLSNRAHLEVGNNSLLPPDLNDDFECLLDPTAADKSPCFLAGDRRVNEQIALISMHTLWMREHNRIAEILEILNPHWDAEIVFQETRKIVAAEIQHITYNDWLPKLIGLAGMNMIGQYSGYMNNVDPTILNAFATAAYRVGHTLINTVIFRLDENFNQVANVKLHDAFFAPGLVLNGGGIEPIIRGLIGENSKMPMPDQYVNSELTEKLFELANQIALDLAALNIQRGRDHGLPGYNAFRRYCKLGRARRMRGLRNEIKSKRVRDKLKTLYGHPDNIDLWVGGIAEDPVNGARVGPTFRCILAEQFKRTRNGDRFWYEANGEFDAEQLGEIRRVTLARVICDNTENINKVQRDVFKMASFPQGFTDCNEIPEINLSAWDESGSESSSEG